MFKWDKKSKMAQLYNNWIEIAYIKFGLFGLALGIEFPSDWHEERRGWFRLGFGFGRLAFSFPWMWVVPDNYQCSGPEYGFTFFRDELHLHWGKCNGKQGDPIKVVAMPWQWIHIRHNVMFPEGLRTPAGDSWDIKDGRLVETHPYTYVLKSGEAQERTATTYIEEREWLRNCMQWIPWWMPWPRLIKRSISIDFDGEVGERTGSWKGGTIGCGWDMLPGETMLDTLRRMEKDRDF